MLVGARPGRRPYGASALSLVALAQAAWLHRRPLLLMLGLAGVVALLYPLHEAMDVSAFRWLSSAGAAGLLGAAVWSALLSRRTAAILVQPSVHTGSTLLQGPRRPRPPDCPVVEGPLVAGQPQRAK